MNVRTAALLLALASGCGDAKVPRPPTPIDASVLVSGRILFAAHGSQDPDAPLRLFTVAEDGSGLQEVTNDDIVEGNEYDMPDIERRAEGGWRIAYGHATIRVFDTATGRLTPLPLFMAGRADFDSSASTLICQGGGTGGWGINLWRWTVGTPSPTKLTTAGAGENAEWPSFLPDSDRILFFATYAQHPLNTMKLDGSGSTSVPAPGGMSIISGVRRSGSQFINAQTLTAYDVDSGQETLPSIKGNPAFQDQLSAMGLAPVPTEAVPGQGKGGTFALSVDESRDGKKLVFDALVRDAATSAILGIAIFVYAFETEELRLIYGPEPFDGQKRTNNFNYSVHTPKWIP